MGTCAATTLKLDASYRPLEIIDSIEAFVLCLVGKATAVETYKKEIRTVNKSFQLPAVIVLQKVVAFMVKGPRPSRVNILMRDDYCCQYCNKKFPHSDLTLDHIIPKSRGGQNTWENLVAACTKCNQKKGSKTLFESGLTLKRKPTAPRHKISQLVKKEQIADLWLNYLWNST
jgi:5-methylcytosine-specific restriction endonuclease McrA